MNTKLLMISSAVILGGLGLAATFFPQEILNNAGIDPAGYASLFVQVTGALYIGFAIMNWMAKATIIGGIYSKPVAMGNFTHFFIAALALIKALQTHHDMMLIWIITVVYVVFALLFAWVAFTKPRRSN
ncbi:MAG: hypothetical protein ABI741_02930 [Ferruginibacter sp.]